MNVHENACKQLSLKHIRTKPYTPKTNGKAERFIQSSLREWAYAKAYENSYQRARELPYWLHSYNWHRPRAGIKGYPPISRAGLDVNNLMRLHSQPDNFVNINVDKIVGIGKDKHRNERCGDPGKRTPGYRGTQPGCPV